MRTLKFCLVSCLFMVISLVYISPEEEKPLAEIYKSGSVRFVPVMAIDDESMPKGVFFESAIAVVTNDDEEVYVCDYKAGNIKKFDENGKYTKTIGRKGQGPGEFNRPFDIVVTTDKLIVYDMGNIRVSLLTLDGEFIKSVAVLMDEGRPKKMRALPDGNIVIGFEKVYYREIGKPQDYIISTYSPDLERSSSVFSQQILHNKYKKIQGVFSNIIQPFSPLVYWDVTPNGKIVIGKSDNYEIQIYESNGKKIHSFSKPFKPVKVTDQDKEIFFNNLSYSSSGAIRRGAPDYYKKNTDFPKFKPAFKQILVDSDGNILVCVYKENREEELKYFDAFNAQGAFLGSIQITGDASFPLRAKIKNCTFWLIQTDDEGIVKVVKYKICD